MNIHALYLNGGKVEKFRIISLLLLAIVLGIVKSTVTNETKYIAHRGAALGYEQQENSYQSFEAAINGGFTNLETDVQFTNDDVPILYHNRDSLVPSSNYSDLEAKYTSLESLIPLTNQVDQFYIELKYDISNHQLDILNQILDQFECDVILQVSSLANLKLLQNDYQLLILQTGQFKDYTTDELTELGNEYDCLIGFNYSKLNRDDLEYIDQNTTNDVYWTLDNEADIETLSKYHVYGLMSDFNYEQLNNIK